MNVEEQRLSRLVGKSMFSFIDIDAFEDLPPTYQISLNDDLIEAMVHRVYRQAMSDLMYRLMPKITL
jgi:hypothetical protein